METQPKIDELDKAIEWWQHSLKHETSHLQQKAKVAIIRKLMHQRRKITEQERGISLLDRWEDIRDTARESSYGDFIDHMAENFNELFDHKVASPPPPIIPPPTNYPPTPKPETNS